MGEKKFKIEVLDLIGKNNRPKKTVCLVCVDYYLIFKKIQVRQPLSRSAHGFIVARI